MFHVSGAHKYAIGTEKGISKNVQSNMFIYSFSFSENMIFGGKKPISLILLLR